MELVGIGPVLGKRLQSEGYDKVLGKFLLLKKNKNRFVVKEEWVEEHL